MTEPRRASRRVLIWIVIGVVALVAAVAVYWALATVRCRARPATGHRRRGTVTHHRAPSPAVSTEPTHPDRRRGQVADGERVPRRPGPVPGRPRRRSRARPRTRSAPPSSR